MENDLAVLAGNLRRYRAAAGMTQEQVAEAAGLSRAAYRNLEGGKSEPRAATLEAVSRALNVSLPDLVAPAVVPAKVRFRSKKRLKLRDHVIAEAGRLLADYASVEDVLGERVDFTLVSLRRRPPAGESRATKAAARARRLLEMDSKESVRDICGLLEAAGVKVISMNIASDAFFGLSVADRPLGPAVVVNTWERISVERWIFTAAHELGHLLLHESAYVRDEADEDEKQEREANEFASHFLVPARSFATEWAETRGMSFVDRVLKLKRMFRVSYQTILYRLYEETDKPLWPLFHTQYQAKFGRRLDKHHEPDPMGGEAFAAGTPPALRSEEPDNLSSSDFVEDRRYRLVRRAVESEAISVSRGAEVLGLSLKEMRELAKTWVDVWDGKSKKSRSS